MASLRRIVDRLPGFRLAALRAEVAALREVVLHVNHVVTQLNHEVHAGGERSLPLYMGYAERLRLDADTAIAATQVIERQLALLEERVAAVAPDQR